MAKVLYSATMSLDGFMAGPSGDMSWLVVVWYQETPAFPIEPTVLELLTQIDWDQLATDGEY